MGKPKIDVIELKRLVDEGLKQVEIAKRLDVTESGVSRKMKELKLSVASNVTLQKAGEIVDRKIDALDQLFKINQAINGELDWILENTDDTTDKKSRKEWQDQKIKHSQEIRKQLQLQLDIYRTLYDVEAVRGFQKEVIDAIGRASPEIREQIIHNLQERKAIRGAIDLSGE